MRLPIKANTAVISVLMSAVTASAAYAEPITVYAALNAETSQFFVDKAAEAGIEVEFLTGGGGEIADRLRTEGASSQADVVMGLIDSSMALFKSDGLLKAHQPTWSEGLPQAFQDSDHTYHSYGQTPIMMGYNADLMPAEDAPKSWLDLTKPEFKGRYYIRKMSSQTTRSYLAGILLQFSDEKGDVSDEGWDFVQALFENGHYTTDSNVKRQAFASGDSTIDLNYFAGIYSQAESIGYKVSVVHPEGGTPVVTEGIAMTASTDQPKESQAFIDLVGTPAIIAEFANTFGTAPAHPEAVQLLNEETRNRLESITPQDIDWGLVATKIDEWMQRIELEIL